eukprot:1778587-Pleurochrysis_carterae.AAC.2
MAANPCTVYSDEVEQRVWCAHVKDPHSPHRHSRVHLPTLLARLSFPISPPTPSPSDPIAAVSRVEPCASYAAARRPTRRRVGSSSATSRRRTCCPAPPPSRSTSSSTPRCVRRTHGPVSYTHLRAHETDSYL